MIPQFTPTHWFSAFCDKSAIFAGSQATPEMAANARAVASSIDADDDKPAPIGTSPATTPFQPLMRCPASCSAHATPLMYSAQPASSFLKSASENSTDWSKSSE